MKRKKNKYSILLALVSGFLFMLADTEKAEAAVTKILDSPDGTIVDGDGNIIGGDATVDMHNVIPLSYVGSSRADDTTVTVGTAAPVKVVVSTAYKAGSVFRVANAGYYDGEPITLAFKSTNKNLKVVWATNASGEYTGLAPIPSGNTFGNDPSYEIWLEDAAGNEITNPNVRVLLPFYLNYSSSGYLSETFTPSNSTAGHLFVRNATKNDGIYLNNYISVDITNTYTAVVATLAGSSFNYVYPMTGHLVLDSKTANSGTYPNGTVTTNTTNNSLGFFSSTVVPLVGFYNAPPVVNDTVNDTNLSANVSVTQTLYGQSSDSFYPDSLDVAVTVPNLLKTVDDISKFTVTDQTGTDITSQVSLTSTSNGQIQISIPKATLQSLGTDKLVIQGMVDVDQTNAKLMDYYDESSGYFTFSESAKNTDSDITNTGTAKVKMPGPTADPVPQTVGQGTSTDDLLPRDLVTNLSSLIPNDVVTVVGFKEKKTFSTIGSDSAVVQIKSTTTGLVSDITVPITVKGGTIITEQANISWANTGIVSDKSEETSSAGLASGSLQETVYWQTTLTNKRYQLVVKKGTTIITQKLADSTSTGDNSWMAESLDIPTDQLSIGTNNLTISMYVLKQDGSLKGGPLTSINLTVNVIDDNAQLSWTNSTTDIQKTKTEAIDKSTMEDSLVETLYWETTTANRNYLLVTKDATGSVVTSQAVANNATVNQFQQTTISLPTSAFNYGDNVYTVGVYAKDSSGAATGTALDQITLTVTVTGTLQLVSVPDLIDFNVQDIDPRKTIRVDDPTVTGALVIADTRDIAQHSWTVKVSLTKEFENTSETGKTAVLRNVLRYKAPDQDEFLVTADAQEIAKQANAYGTYNISSDWGNTKDSAGFKFETPPAYIGQLGDYTAEITYTISETYEP